MITLVSQCKIFFLPSVVILQEDMLKITCCKTNSEIEFFIGCGSLRPTTEREMVCYKPTRNTQDHNHIIVNIKNNI